MRIDAIITAPPYATFLDEVARHPVVSGLRLNTVMPVKGELKGVLERLASFGKTLYVDLKGRQLRVAAAALPPFTEIRLTHRLKVKTPAIAFFDDGREMARVLEVDGDRLILEDGPHRVVGPGESLNIVCPSLEVLGTLTETDRAYVAAARSLGLHDYMLSYVESKSDLDELRSLDPEARIVLKIESRKGLAFARSNEARAGRLMAARGDLYVEVERPHQVVGALRDIIASDPEAMVASRLFPSLRDGAVPAAQDITDAAFLLDIGYRTFMLGDEVSFRRESVISALNLLDAIAADAPVPPPSRGRPSS